MSQLLVVDDDKIIRKNLVELIRQQASGFTSLTEAYDGKDALEKIRKQPPNVVITDVMMPSMDGIQLISMVAKEFPDIIFIVLSNYDDFAYVKQALKTGAIDYLLKFEISAETVAGLLDTAEQEMKKRAALKQQQHAFSAHTKQHFLRQLMNRQQGEASKVSPGDSSGYPFDRGILLAARCQGQEQLLTDSLQRLADLLKLPQEGICFSHQPNQHFLLLTYPTPVSFQTAWVELMEQLNWNHGLFEQERCIISVSSRMIKQDTFSKECDHCIRMLDAGFYETKLRLVTSRTFIPFTRLPSLENGIQSMGMVIRLLQKNQKAEAKNTLQIQLKHFKHDWAEPGQVLRILEHLAHELSELCNSFDIGLPPQFTDGVIPSNYFAGFWNLADIEQALLGILDFINLEVCVNKQGVTNDIVSQAIDYICKNYPRPIHLQSTADAVGVSKNHLCRLFKQHAKGGFHKILNDVRISRAKQLLCNTDMSLQEIAYEVGFSDYRYFKKVFLGTAGMFPAEYRAQQG